MADKKYLSYVQQGDEEYIIRDPDINKKLDLPSSAKPEAGSILGVPPKDTDAEITWVKYTEYLEDYALTATVNSKLEETQTSIRSDLSELETDIASQLTSKANLINGKIPASELPSFVDDVVDCHIDLGNNTVTTVEGGALTPETSKIYVDVTSNKTYRWSGTLFVEISASVVLGEAANNAFPGDRGLELEQQVKSINTTLSSKADKSELFSKSYNDLTDKPEIPDITGLATEEAVATRLENKANKEDVPTKISQLTNDSGFITADDIPESSYVISVSDGTLFID